jgi:hypothetical protein
MNEELDPQVEAAVTHTYAAHARKIGQPIGRLDDVLRRVGRRRNKRRALAGIASVALVGAGIAGIVAAGQMGSEAPAAGAPGLPVTAASEGASWFVCSGAIERDGATVYDWCELETPYDNPAWSCSDEVVDPAVDGDDRLRFQNCTAVGEAYVYTELCPAPTVAPTTTIPGGPLPLPPPPTTWVEEPCAAAIPATTTTVVLGTVPVPSTPGGTPWTVPASTAIPTTPPPCNRPCDRPAGVEQHHIAVAGDTLSAIATEYGVTVEVLLAYNLWDAEHMLTVGELVRLPPEALPADDLCVHFIAEGDNPTIIADRFRTTVERLQELNPGGSNFDYFHVGSPILVPFSPDVC